MSAATPSRAAGESGIEIPSFQVRVDKWIRHCFGEAIRGDKAERNHRFIEEALELVQAAGCTASEAHQLVDYVFGRSIGDVKQEVGGVMNTLAALCNIYDIDLDAAAETELRRVWTKSDQIRAKQAAKPKHSALPA
jgi:NTP pyrophosphatase (non-canonical NTP hydrolase)